jgi:Na+-translocating ferredoxin:NAD+ oxidoreductase RnfC subunit
MARYDMESMDSPLQELANHYPELATCNDCKACNVCPEWIDVAAFVRTAKEGGYEATADKVMDCHMCGLCASRCPKSIAPQYVGLYIQRSCARQRSTPPNLAKRLQQMAALAEDREFAQVAALNRAELEDYCRKVLGS